MLRPLRRSYAAASCTRSARTASDCSACPQGTALQSMQRTPSGAVVLVPMRPESGLRFRLPELKESSRITRSSATPNATPKEAGTPRVAGPFATKSYEQLVRFSQASYIKLLFRSRFLGGVCKRIFADARNKNFEPFRNQVRAIQKELIDQNMRFSFMKPDAKNHLFVASLVLATYRTLAEQLGEDAKAIEVVQGAFVDQMDLFYNVLVPMYLTKKDDDLVQLEGALKTHTRVMGDSFDVTFVRTPSGFSATVKRCFFNDFMEANRASFLMGPVFCTADNMWKAVLPPSKHVQYRRPSTLASGGKSCHFVFKCKETVEEKSKEKGKDEADQLRLGFS